MPLPTSSDRGSGIVEFAWQTETLLKMRRRSFEVLAAAIVLVYPLAGLYPYRWDPPRLATNTLEALPDGGLRFAAPGPGIARSSQPPRWAGTAMRTHRFEVALSVRSYSLEQRGPARILTLSRGPSLRNFTLAQDRKDLIVRIRTPKHDLNGYPQYRVRNVFGAERWIDIRIVVDPGSLRAEVDGELRLRDDLSAAPLRNWDRSYHLALGNELTGNRPWLGEIRRAVVRTAEDLVDYVEPGVLEVPSQIFYVRKLPVMALFQDVRPRDAVINLVGFVPLGLLLGLWARRTGRLSGWAAMAFVFATSLAIETLQLGIPKREPSFDDLIFNTLGGAAGIGLARWLRRPPFVPGGAN